MAARRAQARALAHPLLLPLLMLALPIPIAAQDSTVSLTTITAFQVQRTCVQACLYGPHTDGAMGVFRGLGCSISPMLDSCMCKTAMAAAVSSSMTECVSSYCGGKSADLSAALSLYNQYCLGSLTIVTSAATVSLSSAAEYSAQVSCVQGCLMHRPADGATNLAWALQCSSPVYNDCMCRTDQAADANKFLTQCVNKYCNGDTADISSAVSLYSGYCGGIKAPAQATGAGDGNGSPSATPGGTSGNSQPGQTQSSSNGNSNGDGSNSNGNSQGPSGVLIGGVVGGVVGGMLLVGVLVWFLMRQRRSSKDSIHSHMTMQGRAPDDGGWTSSRHGPAPAPVKNFYPSEASEASAMGTSMTGSSPAVNHWLNTQAEQRRQNQMESETVGGDNHTVILGRPD